MTKITDENRPDSSGSAPHAEPSQDLASPQAVPSILRRLSKEIILVIQAGSHRYYKRTFTKELRMIKLTVSGLTREQLEEINEALPLDDLDSEPQVTPHIDGTYGVTMFGAHDANVLVDILRNEDSGADYLA